MSYLGWLGNIFIVVGIWRVGNRQRNAFFFSIVGEIAWIIKSLYLGQYDLAVICGVFALLAVRSYVKWGRA